MVVDLNLTKLGITLTSSGLVRTQRQKRTVWKASPLWLTPTATQDLHILYALILSSYSFILDVELLFHLFMSFSLSSLTFIIHIHIHYIDQTLDTSAADHEV